MSMNTLTDVQVHGSTFAGETKCKPFMDHYCQEDPSAVGNRWYTSKQSDVYDSVVYLKHKNDSTIEFQVFMAKLAANLADLTRARGQISDKPNLFP